MQTNFVLSICHKYFFSAVSFMHPFFKYCVRVPLIERICSQKFYDFNKFIRISKIKRCLLIKIVYSFDFRKFDDIYYTAIFVFQIVGDYFITAPTHLFADRLSRRNVSVYLYNYEYKSLLDPWEGKFFFQKLRPQIGISVYCTRL